MSTGGRRSSLRRRARRLRYQPRQSATDLLAGAYRSAFRGQGMTFDDVRRYEPGDDVRFIHWQVSARLDETYVKRFIEERETRLMLFVDVSSSTSDGEDGQCVHESMLEVAELFALAAATQGDPVGLQLHSVPGERFIAPRKGARHVQQLVAQLERPLPGPRRTALGPGLFALDRRLKQRTAIIVLSDFCDQDFAPALKRLARKHWVLPIHMRAPGTGPEILGEALIEDAESGALLETQLSALDTALAEEPLALLPSPIALQAGEDPMPALTRGLRRRARADRPGRRRS